MMRIDEHKLQVVCDKKMWYFYLVNVTQKLSVFLLLLLGFEFIDGKHVA